MFSLRHTAAFRPAVLLLWAAVACACGKTLTQEEPCELRLRAAAAASTKANPELAGASLGTDNAYVILASASTTGEPEFLTGQLFTYYASEAYWQASTASGPGIGGSYTHSPVYWPLGRGQVDILALALKPEAYAALTSAPGGIAFGDAAHGGAAGGVTISNWDTCEDQYDVMCAVKNGQSSASAPGGTVPLVFQHVLALVGFTAKNASGDDGIFTIKGLTFKDLAYKGTLTVDNSATVLVLDWDVPAGVAYRADKTIPLVTPEFSVPDAGASESDIQCTDNLLVIPQTSCPVTMTYHVKNSIPDLTCTLALPRIAWKAGHKYIYNLEFRPTGICVSSVTVTDWDGTPVDDAAIVSN